jgi:hypothetical protein
MLLSNEKWEPTYSSLNMEETFKFFPEHIYSDLWSNFSAKNAENK